MDKSALTFGISGHDGSFLGEFLLEKGYAVPGITRRASSFNTQRIDHIYQAMYATPPRLKHYYGGLTDASSLTRIPGWRPT
ncbi:GDP-mannose 4,6-dehydratase [Sphingorhabdus sp.]|jgi:GDPmannose 4,6-dehydratase|uniref:GDP-mannose 4,6-dehydratase n=1 Tax=Sphingorhabdus sp. TaxID=1902408 RepID=UPI0037C8BEA8